jgi:hypothetical protein
VVVGKQAAPQHGDVGTTAEQHMGLPVPPMPPQHPPPTQEAQVFEVVIFYKLHHDVFVWLDLQHLQDKAHEGGWLLGLAAHAAHLHGGWGEERSREEARLRAVETRDAGALVA